MSFRTALSVEVDEAEIMKRNGNETPVLDPEEGAGCNWTGKVHVPVSGEFLCGPLPYSYLSEGPAFDLPSYGMQRDFLLTLIQVFPRTRN